MKRGERESVQADEQFGWPVWGWASVRWPLVAVLLVAFVVFGVAASRTEAFGADVRFTRWLQELDWQVLDWSVDATNWSMSGTPLTVFGIAVFAALVALRWWVDAGMLAAVIAIRLVNHLVEADPEFDFTEELETFVLRAERTAFGPSTQAILEEAASREASR